MTRAREMFVFRWIGLFVDLPVLTAGRALFVSFDILRQLPYFSFVEVVSSPIPLGTAVQYKFQSQRLKEFANVYANVM